MVLRRDALWPWIISQSHNSHSAKNDPSTSTWVHNYQVPRKKAKMNLSPKVVLHRANTMKSALGFFSAYREYLLTGELANAVSPIIAKVDAGETMPSQALPQVAQAIFEHVCASDRAKLVEKKAQQDQRVSTAQAVKEEKAEKTEK